MPRRSGFKSGSPRWRRIAQTCCNGRKSWSPEDIWIEDGFVGAAYGVPSEGGIEAIYRVAQAEGVLLDPVYTGKAMHGLISLVQEGKIQPNSRVIFVHCGGSPALYPFAQKLLER
ncbi:1-aminocyclopropane-1-carboxylate deaminase [Ewingella americana]|uniref:1-aminocyclopropane-1-carboxylate deaminase n=1 Tax=Ewingella americana TaxID=41202 RepID=A0A377THC4_9GAMM|nr:1-aminocyclopropane-1-carboxylate deaminase [Ewingella americana]